MICKCRITAQLKSVAFKINHLSERAVCVPSAPGYADAVCAPVVSSAHRTRRRRRVALPLAELPCEAVGVVEADLDAIALDAPLAERTLRVAATFGKAEVADAALAARTLVR